MDGCWLDFGKKVYVNPKRGRDSLGTILRAYQSWLLQRVGNLFGLHRLSEKREEAPQDHRDF